MKTYVSWTNEKWILDRIAEEWRGTKSEVNTNSISEADVIWCLHGYLWRRIAHEYLQKKKLIVSIHHVTPWKFDQVDFAQRDVFVDAYHVPCEITKNFIQRYTAKPIYVVGYWYNPELWHPMNKQKHREEYNLSDEEFVIGSFQRDTEGSDLKSPKLEKGPDLFCDYIEKLAEEKNVHVLLNGWRRQYVMNRLNDANIKFTYEELPPISEVAKMYAACDLYVVAARHEGGPQAVLEAPAMKVPIVSTNVGMASEALPESCVFNVENKIYIPTEQDVEDAWKKVQKFKLNDHIENYVAMLEEVNKK
tara:strand:+ start:469 stop:1383 length:915 start_codon:yes stop_codon:yes gene_type:complete